MDDSELGNFFAEIEELVTQDATDTSPAVDVSASDEVAAKKLRVEEPPAAPAPATVSVTAAAAPAVVYSKPAELRQTSHTVYTYDAAQFSGAELTPANPFASPPPPTTAPPSAAPAPPTHPPPVFPRSDKKFVRKAANDVWVDNSLQEWPENDFRIFVGDLAKETSTEHLAKAFQHFPSFAKAKVIRGTHDNKSKGYGFVSFLDPMDCVKAMREMNGKYLGSRPMSIKRSDWKERDIKEVHKKDNKKRKILQGLGLA